MADPFPLCELPIIDLTIRMFTEPRLEGDIPLLRKIHNEEILTKNERLFLLGVGERDLASADKFAAILEAEGVEVVYKPGKLKPIPALAKTDPFMQELLDHDDERIRELAQARLDVKSTITETRSARLGQMAERRRLCVYLHYCGAHTRRWSGGDDVNFQNLGRRSELRRAIRAPDGFLLAAPDQSQGECRILNWLAGQSDVIARFRRGRDPYLPMASLIYGETITDPKDPRRQAGKVAELQLGFGSGAPKFQQSAKRAGVVMTDSEAQHAVKAYRESHKQVVALWREADDVLRTLSLDIGPQRWRSLLVIRDGRIYHPNGTWLDYSRLKWEEGEWRLYGRGGSWRKMYGAKLVENVVQWLSRIVTAEAMVKFDRAGYQVVGTSHDDIWLLVDEEHAEASKEDIISIMSETPAWASGLPLAADCKMGKTYGG
jgi:hypothetical protein